MEKVESGDLISIVVPVYKVEKYLPKCVDSIRMQTYKNLEIILVDDGSPDNCGMLCEQYAKEDARIKVVHKPNGGLSDARNAGIEIATGRYISFVDSDDYIHPQMIELLLEAIEHENADLSVCSWKKIREGEKVDYKEYIVEQYKSTDGRNIQSVYFEQSDLRVTYTVAWAKLMKRELYDNIRYPKGLLHEDEYTTYKVLYKADKIAYIDAPLYYYLSRENSIMGDFKAARFAIFGAYLERVEFYNDHMEYNLAKRTLLLAVHMLVQYYEWMNKENEQSMGMFNKYYSECRRVYKEYKNHWQFTFGQTIEINFFMNQFAMYRKLWKLIRLLKNKRRTE